MAIANTVAIAKQVTDWDFTPGESEAGPTALGGPRGSGKPLSGPEQISHQRIRSSVPGPAVLPRRPPTSCLHFLDVVPLLGIPLAPCFPSSCLLIVWDLALTCVKPYLLAPIQPSHQHRADHTLGFSRDSVSH